jgi:ribosome-associated protein
VTATESSRELALTAAQAAADKLATDIVLIDVSDRLALTDCFVLATGANERQVGAIVDEVTERLSRAGVKPLRREGERDGRWVLLDFLDVVVHVQHAEERVFYALDRLWKDCPTIPFTDASVPGSADPAGAAGSLGSTPATGTPHDPRDSSGGEADLDGRRADGSGR